MIREEQYSIVIKAASNFSYSIFKKIPDESKRYYTHEDLKQSLILKAIESKHNFDPEKGDLTHWLSVLYKNKSNDIVNKIWNEHRAFFKIKEVPNYLYLFNDMEHKIVYVDHRCSESIYIENKERKEKDLKMVKIVNDVKDLCTQFGVAYDRDEMLECLTKVLHLTLSQMPEDDFNKLPYATQEKLAFYGEGLKSNSIKITRTGKIRSSGATKIVEDLISKGEIDYQVVKRQIEKNGIMITEKSLRTLIWKCKKRAGIPILSKSSGIRKRVLQLFDLGRGVTDVPTMMKKLKEDNIPFAGSTIRTLMHKLRKEYGLISSSIKGKNII